MVPQIQVDDPNVQEEVRGEFVARHALGDELGKYTTYVDYNRTSCFNLTWESDRVKWYFPDGRGDTVILGVAIVLQTPCQRDLSADYGYSDSDINDITTRVDEFLKLFHKNAVHLDIKPGNIVYCATSKNYHIIDFGSATVLETDEEKRLDNMFDMIETAYTPMYASSTWMAYKIRAAKETGGVKGEQEKMADVDNLIATYTKLSTDGRISKEGQKEYAEAVERLKAAKEEYAALKLQWDDVANAAKENDYEGLKLTIKGLKNKKV